jgi:hypothetical protein
MSRSRLSDEAQIVFNLLESKENFQILISVFRNLFSLERRCKSNENIKVTFLENMSILEQAVGTHLLEDEHFKGLTALNKFRTTLLYRLEACHSHKLPNSRKLNKLSGPCSFTLFENVLNTDTKILILGEFHDLDKTCKSGKFYEIQDWLYDLSKDAPECLDIFIEEVINAQPVTNNIAKFENFTSPLQTVVEQFNDLLKRKEHSYTTRCHFVDVRSSFKDSMYYDKLIILGLEEKNNQDFYNRWKLELPMIRNYYLGFESEKNHANGEMMTKQYISEVFKNTHGANITNTELNHMHTEIVRVRDFIKRQLRKSILFVPKIKEIVAQWEPKNLLSILSNGMDIFLLTRVFSKFDASKMNRGPLFCRNTPFPKNIIIYCGDAHQEFVTFFLHRYFEMTPQMKLRCTASKCLTFDPAFDFFKSTKEKDVIEIE